MYRHGFTRQCQGLKPLRRGFGLARKHHLPPISGNLNPIQIRLYKGRFKPRYGFCFKRPNQSHSAETGQDRGATKGNKNVALGQKSHKIARFTGLVTS